MPTAWRIVKERYAASALDGEGAFLTGGRWNSPGRRVIYTSSTLALAALETRVHMNPPAPLRYVSLRLDFSETLMEILNPASLPPDWRAEPPGPSAQARGDAWLERAATPILAVPSVIIPEEINYLLNPAHRLFKRIRVSPPEPFIFDPRLL